MRMVLNKTINHFCLALLLSVLSACSVMSPANDSAQNGVGPNVPLPGNATEPTRRPPRLGLALGGGAARGFAHVGVIQVLEQNGIRPDLVVGTSAGSLVAALYASGQNGAALERSALAMDEATLTDWSLPIFGRGMLKGEALARYVRHEVQGRLLENMPMPLGVLATDLATGQGVLFRRGDAATAVRASSAVPGVFEPVRIAGHDYVDGGLVAPVPVRHARDMGAEVVIAVDISAVPENNSSDGSFRALLQTFAIMGQTINRHELGGADVVLRPQLAGMGSADFSSRQRAMAAGRAAMQAALPQLKAAMAQLREGKPKEAVAQNAATR